MKNTKKPTKKPFGKPSGRPARAGKPENRRSSQSRDGRDSRSGDRSESRRDPGYSPLRDTRAPKTVSTKRKTERKPERAEPSKRNRNLRSDAPRRSRTSGEEPRIRTVRPERNDRPERQNRPEREPRAPRTPRVSLGPRPNMFGQHAVREAWLNSKRSIHALYMTEDAEKTFASWPSPRVARPMPIIAGKDDLERMLGRDSVHQGFAMSAAPLEESFVQDIISIGAAKDRSVVLMLDQVTDPHNVGAILRSASAFGADGVVMQKRHAPELEGVLCKTACGAVDHLMVAYETNLSRSLEELTEAGYVVIGLDEHADNTLADIEIPEKAVLVLGNEGDGMRRLIRDHCDVLVTLPTQKPINSLNVSNAAAVALYALVSG